MRLAVFILACVAVLSVLFLALASPVKVSALEEDIELRVVEADAAKSHVRVLTSTVTSLKVTVATLRSDLARCQTDLNSTRPELEARLREAERWRKATEEQQRELASLQQEILAIVRSWDQDSIAVKLENGRLEIVLRRGISYKTNSWGDLTDTQFRDLMSIGGALAISLAEKRYFVIVEGHTDSDAATYQRATNWANANREIYPEIAAELELEMGNRVLGLNRATLVLLAVRRGAQLKVKGSKDSAAEVSRRIMAASAAHTRPLIENRTLEGKAANRRIEIVVYPDLTRLYSRVRKEPE